MQLTVPVFRIKHVMQLSVNTMNKVLTAEHSDMGNIPLLSQLYDDACDVGLAMLNTQTGVTTRWHLLRKEKDNKGDLQVTIFAPCCETLRMHRNLEGWTFHVLND